MLTKDEERQLADLLRKAEWPLSSEVFHALLSMSISNPIELGVFNEVGHVLMIYRDDWEFAGWHLPGTVVRDNEDVPTAVGRLVKGEVNAGVSNPVPLGWLEFARNVHPTRHAVSLLHICFLLGKYMGEGKFFDPAQLPEDTLVHHKIIVPTMIQRARQAGITIGRRRPV